MPMLRVQGGHAFLVFDSFSYNSFGYLNYRTNYRRGAHNPAANNNCSVSLFGIHHVNKWQRGGDPLR